ncbi:MAG TPA: carboxypeptidase regulatory-like domain-containing protein [Pyrinomonadaceae bacterium]|nr:carboxypeptidase regulatory-like domain-containing protein [Pyrinomonadaceae bacterium]
MKYAKRLSLLLLATILSIPLLIAHAAGGRIEGKITDPKGAAIFGATVTVTNQVTKQDFTAVTDNQGKYKVESLPAGIYAVRVTSKGFNEGRRDEVKVEDDAAATIDMRLEITPVEAQVKVAGQKPNQDPIYQSLRQLDDFSGNYAVVNNLQLKKDAANFNLKSGELYFIAPVENRVTAAVFIGDGELTLTPPTEAEKNSIKVFTGEGGITESFNRLVLRFSDKTFEDIKSNPNATMKTGGPAASQARSAFRDNRDLLKKTLRDNRELRALYDIYAPAREGCFTAFINGKRFSKLIYTIDPLGAPFATPEEVSLMSYGDSDGGIWLAFHREDELKKGTASSAEDNRLIDINRHEINATIKGTHLAATDRVTFRNLRGGTRVVPFALYPTLRVSKVQDADGNDLSFIQEDKNEDADFGVIMAKPLEAGQTYSLAVQYEGNEAIRDSGAGNFILIPRATWYPGNANSPFEDRAIFEMTFRYPKNYTFVGTGAPTEPETKEGDLSVAKWSSGQTELTVAGFNYGRFKKKVINDKDSGYDVEFYANTDVPDEIKELQQQIERLESQGMKTGTTLQSITTTGMADVALADAQNASRIYNLYFGKLPYSRIAMTQQPAPNFGQAWPTLVYMPYLAFIDTTQRAQLLGTRGGTDNFWRYVAPHEIAHQWWGHIIGWDSYHDQWMSEGFAEFSASLYVQFIRGNDKFIDFWEELRKQVVEATPATKGRKPYTIGPVTQGYRLDSGKTGDAARYLIYPKGAYILHMIRMMMYSQHQGGDARFQAMMKDFIQSHFNKQVSTEDFKAIVERHMTQDMNVDNNGKMDWFFNEWVYGTQVPAYKLEYNVSSDGTLNGKITQSGVSDNFVMLVPVYIDMGKGWAKLGSARVVGNSSIEIKNIKLPAVPKRVAICAMNDVLATSIENSK